MNKSGAQDNERSKTTRIVLTPEEWRAVRIGAAEADETVPRFLGNLIREFLRKRAK